MSAPSIDDVLHLEVVRRETVADDVVELELARPSREHLPEWTPGAHIDLVLPTGAIRQYSLVGTPTERRHWRIAILHEREGRGGSAYIHSSIREGTSVPTRGPFNH